MIARAADGSVRDGLSLLDQAIALSGGGEVSAAQVQTMLGPADREAIRASARRTAVERWSWTSLAGRLLEPFAR